MKLKATAEQVCAAITARGLEPKWWKPTTGPTRIYANKPGKRDGYGYVALQSDGIEDCLVGVPGERIRAELRALAAAEPTPPVSAAGPEPVSTPEPGLAPVDLSAVPEGTRAGGHRLGPGRVVQYLAQCDACCGTGGDLEAPSGVDRPCTACGGTSGQWLPVRGVRDGKPNARPGCCPACRAEIPAGAGVLRYDLAYDDGGELGRERGGYEVYCRDLVECASRELLARGRLPR